MSYGVTQQMIDTYGEIIFKLSLNKQSRRGDAVRELNFEEIEKQRETTGARSTPISRRLGSHGVPAGAGRTGARSTRTCSPPRMGRRVAVGGRRPRGRRPTERSKMDAPRPLIKPRVRAIPNTSSSSAASHADAAATPRPASSELRGTVPESSTAAVLRVEAEKDELAGHHVGAAGPRALLDALAVR